MAAVLSRIVTYVGLLALLGISAAAMEMALGPVRVALHLGAAAAQICLIAGIFMEVRSAPTLVKIFAFGSLPWLLIMFGFVFLDYL